MSITVVGLGPSTLDVVDAGTLDLLTDPDVVVVVRTIRHPAAEQLSSRREVIACDDLYESLDDFSSVYDAVVDRVMENASSVDVVYAVPGSPVVGELTVPKLRERAGESGVVVAVRPALSFLDLVYDAVGLDPIADGLQVVDARDLPDPLPLHLPTVITQVDSALRSADVAISLGRLLDDDALVTVLDRLGDADEVVAKRTIAELATYEGGPRTSVHVPAATVGILGLVATNRVLREECPWDRKQTHHTLLNHLIEEAYETADAIGTLPVDAPDGEADFGAYAELEEELGDLLLQVVFHATLASEAGAFDIDDVAEQIRRKLVRRHPHVFADVEVGGPEEVLANWEQIKQEEKSRDSLMDDVPVGMPSIARAMKVQGRAASVSFDWDDAEPVYGALLAEIEELRAAAGDPQAQTNELGDVLFTVVNLARHITVDPELALRTSIERFMDRFRAMEQDLSASGESLHDQSPEALETAWHRAKAATMGEQAATHDHPAKPGANESTVYPRREHG